MLQRIKEQPDASSEGLQAGFARLRNLFFTRVHREQLIRGLDWAAEEMLGSFENGAGHSCSIVELVI